MHKSNIQLFYFINYLKSQSSTSPNTSISEENICNAITSNDERHDSV
jgi:hypothetical protein